MLSKILVPVRGDGMVATVMGHAAELAKRHKAHVLVVHCRMQPSDLIPQEVLLPRFARQAMVRQASEHADSQEKHLRGVMHRLARDFGLEEGPPRIGEAATCEFVEGSNKMADVIKYNGRLADLIVVAKPQRERNLGQSELKAALYGAGRPVLICPGQLTPDETFARHVAIGWNGSLPASRAVSMTLEIVSQAEKVTILCGNKGEPNGATTEELVAYYALRGIEAQPVRFEAKRAAKALLEKTAETGASLLIAGAYSHSHESEMLFGGNTQVIVDATRMPILMAH
ncbi:universal stress protein [Fulvimarina sp. MAC8]|uniref:universal stress protein n=1 Tax=Fulvimarina sp. MAC8 TaxID=3162874 RepID=UPI0032ECF60E